MTDTCCEYTHSFTQTGKHSHMHTVRMPSQQYVSHEFNSNNKKMCDFDLIHKHTERFVRVYVTRRRYDVTIYFLLLSAYVWMNKWQRQCMNVNERQSEWEGEERKKRWKKPCSTNKHSIFTDKLYDIFRIFVRFSTFICSILPNRSTITAKSCIYHLTINYLFSIKNYSFQA